MANNRIMEEILFYIGFTQEYYLTDKDASGYFLFPLSLESIEFNLQRYISNINYTLNEEKIKELFQDEIDSIKIEKKTPNRYQTKTAKHPHSRHCTDPKILKIQENIQEQAIKVFEKYNPNTDFGKISEIFITKIKNVKDLLFLNFLYQILSDNLLKLPAITYLKFEEILQEMEIPSVLYQKITNYDKMSKWGWLDISNWLDSLFSEIPHSFITLYSHSFNSSSCAKRTNILFHHKIAEYLNTFLDTIKLKEFIVNSFNSLLRHFQNEYPTPLFQYRDTKLLLCNKIIEKWNSNNRIYTLEIEDFQTELDELIKKNYLTVIDDQILLKDGSQEEQGLRYFSDSKFYLYRNILEEKENNRIEYNKDRFTVKWLLSKISLKEEGIVILDDYTKKLSNNNREMDTIQKNDITKNLTKISKKIKIFVSYATEDAESFQIKRIIEYLELQTEIIDKVYYWQRDTKGGQDFIVYMREKIKESDFILFICSETSKLSQPVNQEIGITIGLEKEKMAIFKVQEDVPDVLGKLRGVEYRDKTDQDFHYMLKEIFEFITGVKPKKTEFDVLMDFQEILEMSHRIKKIDVADMLEISETELNKKLFIWRKKYKLPFKIDNDLIVVEDIEKFKNAVTDGISK